MDRLNKIFCALFRHSNIETSCFGYIYCARCGELKGDTLAGAYKNALTVGMRCACQQCQENWERTTIVDRFLSPRPDWLGRVNAFNEEKRAQKQALDSIAKSWR